MASCGPTFLSLLFLGQLEKCRQGRKEGPFPRSATPQGEGIARPGARCSVGISPLFWLPSSASGTSPYATTVPSALRAFVWRHRSRPLPSSAEGSAASGTRTLHQHRFRAQQLPRLSVGASAPCCRPATARPPGRLAVGVLRQASALGCSAARSWRAAG